MSPARCPSLVAQVLRPFAYTINLLRDKARRHSESVTDAAAVEQHVQLKFTQSGASRIHDAHTA
jgi:hypothetical protein